FAIVGLPQICGLQRPIKVTTLLSGGSDMRLRIRTILCCTAIFSAVSVFTITFAQTNPFTKAQVADSIRKVENGVDDFEKYLTSRGENAKDQAGSAKSSGATKRGQGANSANKDARKDQAGQSKDDL